MNPAPDEIPMPSAKRHEWNEALWRLNLYLRLLPATDEISIAALKRKIFTSATGSVLAPEISPTAATFQEAKRVVTDAICRQEWPQVASATDHVEQAIALTRVSLARAHAAASVAEETVLLAGPEINLSNMTARDVDYGPLLGATPDPRGEWGPIFRAILLWWLVYWIGFFWLT